MKTFKNISIIFVREFKSYITSPMMYIIMGLFFLLIGLLFAMNLNSFDELCKRASFEMIPLKLSLLDLNVQVLTNFLSSIGFLCLFFFPILTMKSLAEEKKSRTMELLMTSPISTMDIVLGKFLAILGIWIIIVIFLLMYPFILMHLYLVQIDWALYLTAMLGLFLYGALGIAIGLFASTITDSQIFSAIIAFVIIAVLYFLIFLAVQTDIAFSGFIYGTSILAHIRDFFEGSIDTKNVIYFVSATGFTLFLAERSLESQRWR